MDLYGDALSHALYFALALPQKDLDTTRVGSSTSSSLTGTPGLSVSPSSSTPSTAASPRTPTFSSLHPSPSIPSGGLPLSAPSGNPVAVQAGPRAGWKGRSRGGKHVSALKEAHLDAQDIFYGPPTVACAWDDCSASIHPREQRGIAFHLKTIHGITYAGKVKVKCSWAGCGRQMTAQSLARHIQNIHLKMQYTCSKCLACGRPEAYVRDHGPARDCKRVAKVQGNATSLVDVGVDSLRPQRQHPRRVLTDGAPYPSSSGAPSPTNIDGQLPGQATTPQMRNPAFGSVDMGAGPVRVRRRQERRARTRAPYSSSGISLPTSIDVARFAPETTAAHHSSSHPAPAPFAVPDATPHNLDWLAMSYADYHAQAPSSAQDALPHQIPPQTDPVYYGVPQSPDAGPPSAVAMPPAVAPGVMNTTLYTPSLYPQIGQDAPYPAAQDTVPHQILAQPDLAPLVPSGIPQFPDAVPSSTVAMPSYATPGVVDASYAPSLDPQSGYDATYAPAVVDVTPYSPFAHPQVGFDASYAQVYPPFDPGYYGGQDEPNALARYWSQ